jgi:hypothetical protein
MLLLSISAMTNSAFPPANALSGQGFVARCDVG